MYERAVIFDLDGVIVDSHDVMRRAFVTAHAEVVGAGEAPFAEYERHQGRYFTDIMTIMGLPLEMEGPFVRESYRLEGEVAVHDGVRELLAELRTLGFGLAIATGKSGVRARSLLRCLGLLSSFDHVLGSDEVARPKPAPDIVQRALALLGTAPDSAVMVGDAANDVIAARQAGVTAIGALWGALDADDLMVARPEFVLRSPVELLQVLPLPVVAT
ncbi:HAD-IA family hydrolase [Lentzea tibetensis]|uniref:HAD-IA family hydrolase n=1 Tax=Lentzea tibetensis TaxID=2591470 RepID=A0A563EJR2_9PSEU|nr:HAD-IA family hydrolase [Lentzea tibetensis]TWP46945.1 HAD-IA family hydrolase [Lentzea tibetensis]